MFIDRGDSMTLEKRKAKRINNKKKAIAYLGGKCARCSYSKSYMSLHFHHKNGDTKESIISDIIEGSWQRIEQELDKCELLCANCHMEFHFGGGSNEQR